MAFLNEPMQGKRTNKQYHVQGWNAANEGIAIDDCPYYESSTAEKHWKAGHRTASAK